MNILVTGASGGYGGYAVDYLKKFAPQATIFGLVRNQEEANKLKARGFEAREGVINLSSKPYTYGEFAKAIQSVLSGNIEVKPMSKDEYTALTQQTNLS